MSSLTWHSYHGGSSPENIHAGGVPVAQRCVEAHVCQLASPHMLLLGSHGGEDDARRRQTHVLSILLDVWLANSREAKKPQHAVGHALQDLQQQGRLTTGMWVFRKLRENRELLKMTTIPLTLAHI